MSNILSVANFLDNPFIIYTCPIEVIPTIIDSKEKLQEMFRNLEVYYLANKSDFLLLLKNKSL